MKRDKRERGSWERFGRKKEEPDNERTGESEGRRGGEICDGKRENRKREAG